MFFALLDAVDMLWWFLEWLQFVVGVVLFLFIFLYLMALVVGFMDLILNPKSVFLSMVKGLKKGGRKTRQRRKSPSRPKPQPRPEPQRKRKRKEESVPRGAPVEQGGSFVMPHEMKRYLDEHMANERRQYGS